MVLTPSLALRQAVRIFRPAGLQPVLPHRTEPHPVDARRRAPAERADLILQEERQGGHLLLALAQDRDDACCHALR